MPAEASQDAERGCPRGMALSWDINDPQMPQVSGNELGGRTRADSCGVSGRTHISEGRETGRAPPGRAPPGRAGLAEACAPGDSAVHLWTHRGTAGRSVRLLPPEYREVRTPLPSLSPNLRKKIKCFFVAYLIKIQEAARGKLRQTQRVLFLMQCNCEAGLQMQETPGRADPGLGRSVQQDSACMARAPRSC